MIKQNKFITVLVGDRKYKRTEYQEFSRFGEGESFLLNYCGKCNFESKCRTNKSLRSAMGENYPCWSKYFVRLTWRDNYASKLEDDIEFIACKRFKPKKKSNTARL